MTPTIEERLAAIEIAIAELKQNQSVIPQTTNWLERFKGSFKEVPAFDEVIEFGRQWRQEEQPEDGDLSSSIFSIPII